MSVTDNQIAWEKEHEEAWRQRFGDPKVYAEKIKKDPRQTLGSLNRVLPECSGKSVLNVMGSNGNKAVALALLGAKVTVVDLSESNRNYALELAKASDVAIEYVVSDVLAYSAEASFDLALAEMGILHYFLDLKPFFQMIYKGHDPSGMVVMTVGKNDVRQMLQIDTQLLGIGEERPGFPRVEKNPQSPIFNQQRQPLFRS